MPDVDSDELANAVEAMLFAAGGPLSQGEIRKIFDRLWKEDPDEERDAKREALGLAIDTLKERWRHDEARGFALVEVADGLAFRTNPRYADTLRAMREQRPVRLSRAALETLAIVAYRQPVTKPEVDHIRGVDCSSPIHLLLDRGMIKITGKREEPGRPLLYGTTREFLSFFNLSNLAQLPSLREYHELTEDSQEELAEFDGVTVEDLAGASEQLGLTDDEATTRLDQAMAHLKKTESGARAKLEAEGIRLQPAPPGGLDSHSAEAQEQEPGQPGGAEEATALPGATEKS